MRGIKFCAIAIISGLLLSGCCNTGGSIMQTPTAVDYNQCNSCSVCSTCGYNQNYRDSGWY